jgi:hypothetical protein
MNSKASVTLVPGLVEPLPGPVSMVPQVTIFIGDTANLA